MLARLSLGGEGGFDRSAALYEAGMPLSERRIITEDGGGKENEGGGGGTMALSTCHTDQSASFW